MPGVLERGSHRCTKMCLLHFSVRDGEGQTLSKRVGVLLSPQNATFLSRGAAPNADLRGVGVVWCGLPEDHDKRS